MAREIILLYVEADGLYVRLQRAEEACLGIRTAMG